MSHHGKIWDDEVDRAVEEAERQLRQEYAELEKAYDELEEEKDSYVDELNETSAALDIAQDRIKELETQLSELTSAAKAAYESLRDYAEDRSSVFYP